MLNQALVALVRGEDRYQNVALALDLIKDQINLGGKKLVLVKVNFVSTTNQLAATHVEATRAVLDFVRAHYSGPLVIAEGSATAPTFEGFKNYGYLPLASEYDAMLMDLNADEWEEVEILDYRLRPMKVRVARTVLESDFRISVAPPKTHDTVVVTLSLKNIIVGSLIQDQGGTSALVNLVKRFTPSWVSSSPLAQRLKTQASGNLFRNDKAAIHQGYEAINLNMYRLAKVLWPHLSVIDGFEGMEGNGPISGSPVPWRIALAGTDPLAVDSLTTYLMGFDPDEVGYLYYCKVRNLGVGDLARIKVVGNVSPEEVRRRFRPHPSYRAQLSWKFSEAESYL
ncbi:MAG: DUF362 domain-containing protein [Anaerolineae bacterium]|nr:DUF362 domain-containing protein [Anaerolineae bacterium]MDW8101859.1 DUF362 domain-containing protein [Anaerolineae bacterium]